MAELLNARSQQILEAVIEEHIATAQPVGSKAITDRLEITLSSATVRNVMADLEEQGYLCSPHTSAGRVPTEQGYRFYVDTLMRVARIDRQQKSRLEAEYRWQGLQMAELLRSASKALSSVSSYTGLVMMPRLQKTIFRHIEFVKLSSRQILVVFVTQSGLVQNKLIETDEELTAADLEQITNYLNQEMTGLSIQEMRSRILSEMAQEKVLYDQLLQRAMRLSRAALDNDADSEVIIEGTSRFLEQPEFGDLERMKRVFQAFERKSVLFDLLDQGLQADGVQIIIGSETEYSEIAGCSLITAAYSGKRGTLGTLGIIGPSRMPYSTVVPVVGYTADLVSRLLDNDQD
jgi:heat-inducible transcriptional repressor